MLLKSNGYHTSVIIISSEKYGGGTSILLGYFLFSEPELLIKIEWEMGDITGGYYSTLLC